MLLFVVLISFRCVKNFEYDDIVFRVERSGKLWRYKGVVNAGGQSTTALHRDLNATFCFVRIIASKLKQAISNLFLD